MKFVVTDLILSSLVLLFFVKEPSIVGECLILKRQDFGWNIATLVLH